VIVKVTRVGAAGRVSFSDQITAASLEDLEPITKRIAHSLRTGQRLADSATTTTVTENEATEQRRRKALFTSGLRIGVMAPLRDSFGDAQQLTAWTLFGMFEFPSFAFLAEMSFQSTASTEDDVGAFGFHLDFGGVRFTNPESNTGTYVGAGAGFRATSVDNATLGEDSASGFGLYANAGVVLLRTSDFHLIADIRYDINLFRMRDLMGSSRSHGVIVTVGFTYARLGRLLGRY
jgi:hypothetical protein